MSTEAQIAANRINAQASCGPRTAEGRARVSRNAVSHGLFSSGDFVRPDEQDLYSEFCAAFRRDLAPEGAIEQTLAAELTGPPCGDLSNLPRCVASPPLFRHRSRARTR